jgi:hypothetical protein
MNIAAFPYMLSPELGLMPIRQAAETVKWFNTILWRTELTML